MSDSAKEYLTNKFYGEPFLPKDFTLLAYFINIKIQGLIYENYFDNVNHKWNWFSITKDIIISHILFHYISKLYLFVRGYGIIRTLEIGYHTISRKFFILIMSLPPIKSKVQKELEPTVQKIEQELMKNDADLLQTSQLPKTGLSNDEITGELEKLKALKHSDWENGRVSGAVYHGGDDLLELQTKAYHEYAVANQLHPDVFPGVRKMESEVVSMVLNLFNAPKSGCGSTTSGGTESLLLAGLAAREYGKRHRGITEPEIIAPSTVHAGIDKACYYFGITLRKVDLDADTYKVDINKVKKHINRNTILLVGSAPNYPHGIIDDIEALSKLAVKYKIPLHVDACLGSFIVPFLEKTKVHGDKRIPIFDFRLEGVTSISCDTHKYGFAPKGSSIIMYRNPKLRECQYYVLTDWIGGLYGSPTLAGSRPGALMVGCWATLLSIGENGYAKLGYDIVKASMKVKESILNDSALNKYLEVIGDPIGSVIAFKFKDEYSEYLNIYDLGDSLNSKGWHFAALQSPAALHFAFTKLTVPIVEELIEDLLYTVEVLVQKMDTSEKNKATSDTAAFYGVAGSVKTVGVADKLIVAFLDTLYKV
ncbi:uncharacterized protein PRCAT00002608001 [Priceomyces carsonii]|uniref:uncharacterized protein n=1 Tax=Priceomyces carsonii TaxID=28549 RepID=UPI002ED8C195|nr:unnamed protein product [Priceomyces carsonii]